jgi:hypothetical protein
MHGSFEYVHGNYNNEEYSVGGREKLTAPTSPVVQRRLFLCCGLAAA